jgi:predicted nuclease of predicted toxin-antitoxin system
VKLLLDEHLPRVIAEQLRARSYDVIAVTERSDLRGLPDPELFQCAQVEERAIATYNVDDFLDLDRLYQTSERSHAGIVLLSSRRFPRKSVGPLVSALERFLAGGAPYRSFVHWLR